MPTSHIFLDEINCKKSLPFIINKLYSGVKLSNKPLSLHLIAKTIQKKFFLFDLLTEQKIQIFQRKHKKSKNPPKTLQKNHPKIPFEKKKFPLKKINPKFTSS